MHNIKIEKIYKSNSKSIYGLFKDLTVFTLTGADEIECNFNKGEKFLLKFLNTGSISGTITDLTENKKIVLDWSVEGFGRDNENNTQVIFDLSPGEDNCKLTIEHNNISGTESFEAKKRAWDEILDELEKYV